MQTTLIDYAEKLKGVRCPYCGKAFKDTRSLNIHITKKHVKNKALKKSPLYKGEGLLEVKNEGYYTTITVRVRTKAWQQLKRAAKLHNVTPEEAIIDNIITYPLLPLLGATRPKTETHQYIT